MTQKRGGSVRPATGSCNSSRTSPFTVKETHGTGTLQLGEWDELVDDRLWFNVYDCPQCGEVRLVADDTAKRRLLRVPLKVV